jgi:hypothetical protein
MFVIQLAWIARRTLRGLRKGTSARNPHVAVRSHQVHQYSPETVAFVVTAARAASGV